MSQIKEVRFDFYKAVLGLKKGFRYELDRSTKRLRRMKECPEEEWTEEKKGSIKRLEKIVRALHSEEELYQTKKWRLEDAIEAAVKGEISSVMKYREVEIELDKETYIHDNEREPWLYAFQLTKLRATDLPSKKRIGRERENIDLQNDEFIGEFTQIIFDTRYNTIAIQSNRYGVGWSVVCKYLNYIRTCLLGKEGKEKYLYLVGELEPLVDERLAQKALQSGAYKKLKMKCSDVNVNGIISKENATVGSIAGIIGQQSGIVVEVTISVKGRKPTETLNDKDVEEAAQRFLEYMENPNVTPSMKKDANMELTYYNASMNASEAVNLLVPKVNFFVKIEAEERKPINAIYLFNETKKQYDKYFVRLKELMEEENVETDN